MKGDFSMYSPKIEEQLNKLIVQNRRDEIGKLAIIVELSNGEHSVRTFGGITDSNLLSELMEAIKLNQDFLDTLDNLPGV